MINTFDDGGVCMKNKLYRFLAGALTISMVLSSASCKKKNVRAERVVKETDPYFLSEEIKLELPLRSDVELLEKNLKKVHLLNKYVIVTYGVEYVMPPDIQAKWDDYCLNFSDYPVEEAKSINEIHDEYQENAIGVFHLDGSLSSVVYLDNHEWMNGAAEDPNGQVFLFLHINSREVICQIQSDGNLSDPKAVSAIRSGSGFDTFIIPDMDHMIFACSYGEIVITDRKGAKIGHIEGIANFYGDIFQLEDKWYAFCDRARSGLEGGPYLQEIDLTTGTLSDVRIELSKAAAQTYQYKQGKDGLYISTANGTAKVDMINGTFENVFSWNDTDFGFRDLEPYIYSSQDFYCIRTDFEPYYVSGYNDFDLILIHFHKADTNPHAGKSIIVIAYNGEDGAISPYIYERVAEYNLDPEKKARIVFKSYQDVLPDYAVLATKKDAQIAEQVYIDVQSADGPDILMGFGSCSQFNTDEILLDLNPLIGGPSPLDRGTMFDNVLRAAEKGGKLYQLPILFDVRGLIGNTKYFGDQPSLNFEEYERISSLLPETVYPLGPISHEDLLTELLSGSMDLFMDYEKKTVQFDTPDFRAILTFAKEYGVNKEEVLDVNSYSFISPIDRFCNEMDAAYCGRIMGIASFGYGMNDLDGEELYIGIPSTTGSSMMAVEQQSVAISKNSQYQELAWDFIRSLFQKEFQTALAISQSNTVFPVSREAFDICFQMAKKRYDTEAERYKGRPDISVWESSDYSQEVYDNLLDFLNNIHEYASYDTSAMLIILEEAPGYFTGQRSLDDVVKNIQNRCTTIVNERG